MAVPPVERFPVTEVDHLIPGRDRQPYGIPPVRQQPFRLMVKLESGQHLLVADAAAGIAVYLRDQLFDGLDPVADDMAGHSLGHGHQLAVDHQHAVVESGHELLDDDTAAMLPGLFEPHPDLVVPHQIQGNTATVVGIERLDHHRVADASRLGHRFSLARDQPLAREPGGRGWPGFDWSPPCRRRFPRRCAAYDW